MNQEVSDISSVVNEILDFVRGPARRISMAVSGAMSPASCRAST